MFIKKLNAKSWAQDFKQKLFTGTYGITNTSLLLTACYKYKIVQQYQSELYTS